MLYAEKKINQIIYKKAMEHKRIEEKVTAITTEKLDIVESEVTTEAKFIFDLGADSLDFVELMMEFEKEFDIAIRDDEWEKVKTVGDAIELISQKVK